MKTGAMLAAVAGLATAANAQVNGTVTWLWEVSNVIDPGNPSATVTLMLDMSPDVGSPGVTMFGASIHDTIGGANADTGTITGWTLNGLLDNLIGDTTTSNGVDLFNTQLGQIPLLPPNDFSDPIFMMTFTWETSDFTPRTVEYSTSTLGGFVFVWTQGDVDGTEWDVAAEANIAIEVVPAPATAALLGLGGLVATRRRR